MLCLNHLNVIRTLPPPHTKNTVCIVETTSMSPPGETEIPILYIQNKFYIMFIHPFLHPFSLLYLSGSQGTWSHSQETLVIRPTHTNNKLEMLINLQYASLDVGRKAQNPEKTLRYSENIKT